MKPFITIATPHEDILQGKLTQDIFAADLWDVVKNRAPEDYQNPEIFFEKTYLTQGIKNLLDVAKKRLKGLGGDPIIQLQTPFGGGKTHSLIALYHKSKEWKANVVVIDGTALDPKEITLWGEIERQLTGKIKEFEGLIPPGKEKLINILKNYQPLLILMDEVLEYVTRASGIKVGDSNLASQTLAFFQELTGSVRSLEKSLLILSLPSSLLEHYDENAEKFFHQIQKIVGRMERIYTPVQDEEVASIIRKRLFSNVNEKEAKKTIEEFIKYAKKGDLFPSNIDISKYKEKFLKSFPFQPEVIDVLYHNWGSLVTFQRTRGVLRLLSLVIFDLKESNLPFIRLGDFNLDNEEIRREFIKHIGPQFDSVIAKDITDINAGAKEVDKSIGASYLSYRFGTKIATTIFLCSFSGAQRIGVTLNELKLLCAEPDVPSSIVIEVVSKLKEKLFFLQSDGVIYFSDQPNLNLILLTKKANITEEELKKEERELLESIFSKKYFQIYLWPENTKDIPDNKFLKLIILENQNKEKCKDIIEKYGEHPRVYRNSLIFVCPLEEKRHEFYNFLREKIVLNIIEHDKSIQLTKQQKEEIKERIEKMDAKKEIRNFYRIVYLPSKENIYEIDLGVAIFGSSPYLNEQLLEFLKNEGKIIEKLHPIVIRDKYLADRDWINLQNLLETFYKVPGEPMILSDEIFIDCIKEGVKEGFFGLGKLENEKPVCEFFQKVVDPQITEETIIINSKLCKQERGVSEEEFKKILEDIDKAKNKYDLEEIEKNISWGVFSESQKSEIEKKIQSRRESLNVITSGFDFLKLILKVPFGQLSNLTRIVQYLKSKSDNIEIKVEIQAHKGTVSSEEVKEKIKEAASQSQIEIEEIETK